MATPTPPLPPAFSTSAPTLSGRSNNSSPSMVCRCGLFRRASMPKHFPEILFIERAVQVGAATDYSIQLRFNDGKEQIVNFKPFLERSTNPLIREYLDPKRFAAFSLKEGDL